MDSLALNTKVFSACLQKSQLTKWEYRVQASLEQFDLEDLISDPLRPNGNTSSYTKRSKHSKMVRTWLISAIHNDLLDDIILVYCGERLEYADEYLRNIRKIFVGSYAGDHSTRYDIQTVVRSYDQAMLILMKTVMKMTTNQSGDQPPLANVLANVVLHPIQMVEMMQSDTMYD